ncbi:hypothetical protein GCM10010151_40390 [Actinoallomurus spadix]|uniref:Uncharacterized protein n=1 Tax=Actinoallomurus spadix TaxID=79912 RepID=A0ABN0WV59_9ACTN
MGGRLGRLRPSGAARPSMRSVAVDVLSGQNDRMPADDPQLWQLLRSLDDPDHLEFPAGYDAAMGGSSG